MLRIGLNESELQELEERLKEAKSQSALIYMDLKIIEFSNQGKSPPEIGKLLGLHPNTVRGSPAQVVIKAEKRCNDG